MDTFQEQFDKAIKEYLVNSQYSGVPIPVHSHTGVESPQIDPDNIIGNLQTSEAPVNVGLSNPPIAGSVLTATDATHATWQPAAANISFGYVNNVAITSGVNTGIISNQDGTKVDDVLFIGVPLQLGDTPTSVKYNGLNMTFINSTPTTNNWIIYMYYIRSPVDAKVLNITWSGGHTSPFATYIWYDNTSQTAQADTSSTGGPTATTDYTQSITTVANKSWGLIMGIYNGGNAVFPDNETVIRFTANITGTIYMYVADSGTSVSPGASLTLGLNSAVQTFTGVMASILPA